MKVRTLTEVETLELATRQESHFFDRKAVEISGKKIQKIAVAFANADGGEILVGIADDKEEADPVKRWQGSVRIEDLNGVLQALFDLQPQPDFRYEMLTSPRGGYVLRISIEKSSFVHKTADNTVYVRHGAQSLPLQDPQRITELGFAKGAVSFVRLLRINGRGIGRTMSQAHERTTPQIR
jgi:ATP-dependent DNA helicase RecG